MSTLDSFEGLTWQRCLDPSGMCTQSESSRMVTESVVSFSMQGPGDSICLTAAHASKSLSQANFFQFWTSLYCLFCLQIPT